MPPACQALLNRAHLGIEAAAVALVREELRFCADAKTMALMREATRMLVAACARLVEIDARPLPRMIGASWARTAGA